MPKKSKPNFQYVIARPWNPEQPQGPLCVYAYGTEIQEGTMAEAQEMLDYVKRVCARDKEKKAVINSYGIYAVGMTRIV